MFLERLLDLNAELPEPDGLYTRLDFPEPPEDCPYVIINMAATVDGKIVVGEPGGPAKGVGGPTDQKLFRRLQNAVDAAIIGSGTLRASQVIYPPEIARFVVSQSGNVPLNNRFFTDAPERATVLVPEDLEQETLARLRNKTNVLAVGKQTVDFPACLRHIRQQGIRVLLCEGGAMLNDALLRAGLVDELFLTLAPKLKGGAHLPTIVAGQGFPPGAYLPLHLLSLYRDEDELYLRYRVEAETTRN